MPSKEASGSLCIIVQGTPPHGTLSIHHPSSAIFDDMISSTNTNFPLGKQDQSGGRRLLSNLAGHTIAASPPKHAKYAYRLTSLRLVQWTMTVPRMLQYYSAETTLYIIRRHHRNYLPKSATDLLEIGRSSTRAYKCPRELGHARLSVFVCDRNEFL